MFICHDSENRKTAKLGTSEPASFEGGTRGGLTGIRINSSSKINSSSLTSLLFFYSQAESSYISTSSS